MRCALLKVILNIIRSIDSELNFVLILDLQNYVPPQDLDKNYDFH